MKKTRVAFPVCALMALTLCATPTGAFASESSDLAFAEEEVAFVDQKAAPAKAQAAPGKAQAAVADQSLELEEGQSLETIPQDVQVSAGEELEREDENAMQEEGDAEGSGQGSGQSSAQNDVEKAVVNCELKGKFRTHYVGEDLDLTGLYWLVTYDDGSTSEIDVSPSRLDGYNPQREGLQFVQCAQMIGHRIWNADFTARTLSRTSGPTAGVVKMESQYSLNKGRAIKPTTDQLFVAGARMFDTAFVAKKKNSSPTGNNGNGLVERISEGGKPYAHIIKIGVGYRF